MANLGQLSAGTPIGVANHHRSPPPSKPKRIDQEIVRRGDVLVSQHRNDALKSRQGVAPFPSISAVGQIGSTGRHMIPSGASGCKRFASRRCLNRITRLCVVVWCELQKGRHVDRFDSGPLRRRHAWTVRSVSPRGKRPRRRLCSRCRRRLGRSHGEPFIGWAPPLIPTPATKRRRRRSRRRRVRLPLSGVTRFKVAVGPGMPPPYRAFRSAAGGHEVPGDVSSAGSERRRVQGMLVRGDLERRDQRSR